MRKSAPLSRCCLASWHSGLSYQALAAAMSGNWAMATLSAGAPSRTSYFPLTASGCSVTHRNARDRNAKLLEIDEEFTTTPERWRGQPRDLELVRLFTRSLARKYPREANQHLEQPAWLFKQTEATL
jgi:hypothetical protein